MRGKVLGADAAGGTISSEDGKRYKFDLTHWKGARSPVAGEDADFDVGDDGKAHDIYSVRSGAALDFGAVGDQAKVLLAEGVNSPMGAHIVALTRGNPLFQISLVILIASFLLTFVKLSSAIAPGASDILPDRGVYKIVNTNDLIDYLKTSLDAAAASFDQLAQLAQNAGGTDGNAATNPFGDPKAAADTMHMASGFSNVLYLFYLAPVGAIAIVVQLLRRQRLGVIPLATGGICIVSFALLIFCRSAIVSAVKKAGNADAAALAGKAIVFGLGSYVVVVCGLALVGIALGIVRVPQRA